MLFFFNSLSLNSGAEEKARERTGPQAFQEEMGADSLLHAGELPGTLPSVPSAGRLEGPPTTCFSTESRLCSGSITL